MDVISEDFLDVYMDKELTRKKGFARASADLGTRLTSGSHSACQGYFGSNEAKDYVVNPIDNN